MYAYCLNNPINRIDKDGEVGILTWIVIGVCVGAIIGGTVGAVKSHNETGEVQASTVVAGATIGGVIGGTIGAGGHAVAGAISTKVGIGAVATKVATTGATAAPIVQKTTEKIQYSKTALSHITERPYMNSPLTVKNIMEATQPVQETIRANIVRWDVPGSLNGKAGVWELVYDTTNNTIYHFLFRRIK